MTKKIVKTSKRKAQSKSNGDAVADILDWAESLEREEDFELETNRIPYEIAVEDIQPEPEKDTEEPHPVRHREKLSKSRLVHSVNTALHPSNYDEIIYLNYAETYSPNYWLIKVM